MYKIKPLNWIKGPVSGDHVAYVFGNYYLVHESQYADHTSVAYVVSVPGHDHYAFRDLVEDVERGKKRAQEHYETMVKQQLIEVAP